VPLVIEGVSVKLRVTAGCAGAPAGAHRAPLSRVILPLLLCSLFTGVALAQVPPNIETALRAIGPIVDPGCTADLYRPLMPRNDITSGVTPLYPGVSIARNQSFGSNPDDVVDIFSADRGAASRPVLIYVPGGAGNKIEIQNKASNAFYDNIGRWGTQNGMVVVTMQRHFSRTWDGGARDVSSMIQWLQDHIAQYHGDPNRMIIWAHSAGNVPLGTYIGRPELYGPKGVGVIGVIFMSGGFNIAPIQAQALGGANFAAQMARAGSYCHEAGGMTSTAGALPGAAPGTPGGPNNLPGFGGPPRAGAGAAGAPGRAPGAGGARPGGRGGGGGGGGFGPQVDPATLLARSSLPQLKKAHVRIMLADAELDPGINMAENGGLSPFNKALSDALCAVGPEHCPTLLVARGESHVSEVFSIDTPDLTVSGPVLRFIRATLRDYAVGHEARR
jgi:BD-FAE